LYDNFEKFSKSEVLHFWKLEQQRKVPKEIETSRQTRNNRGRQSTISFDNTTKHINNIDKDGCGPPKNWEKNFGLSQPKHGQRAFDTRKDFCNYRGGHTG
jgi:hypothetical protein